MVSTFGCVADSTDAIIVCTEGCDAGSAVPNAYDVVALGWYADALTVNTTRERRVISSDMDGCQNGRGWAAGLARIVLMLGCPDGRYAANAVCIDGWVLETAVPMAYLWRVCRWSE